MNFQYKRCSRSLIFQNFCLERAEQNSKEIDEEMSNVVTDDEQKWRNYICSFYLHDTFEMIECWDL